MVTLNLFLPEFFLYFIVNTVFIILISPFYSMLIKKIKAFAQKRRGPPLFQGYWNLWKLLKKERKYSNVSSIISRISPIIIFMTIIMASISVQIVFIHKYFNELRIVILFLYFFSLAKFFMALGGLDAGSTFGGMGSSREMTVLAVFEPIIVLVFVALSFTFKTADIYTMFSLSVSCFDNYFFSNSSCAINTNSIVYIQLIPFLLPIILSLFIILIVETARIPVDNPETHLELTMIHEAMLLEQSGSNFALLEISSSVKQTLLMAILINLLFPFGLATDFNVLSIVFSMIFFFIKGVILAVIIGLFESSVAKFRLMRLPSLFGIAFFLPLITIAMIILS